MAKERVNGPYPHGKRYRVVLVGTDGRQVVESFATEAKAQAFKTEAERQAEYRTISQAMESYLEWRKSKGRSQATLTSERFRLTAMLGLRDNDRGLRNLTPREAVKLVGARVAAADTVYGEITVARRFGRYCVTRGWLSADPFVAIELPTRTRVVRSQLRQSEAKRFLDSCLDDLSPSGIACATTLLLGMRASEVVGLTVRDIDEGSVWITSAKTKAGVRRLDVPPLLWDRLSRLSQSKASGSEKVFGGVTRYWLTWHVARLCKAAGVPTMSPHGLRRTHATLAVEAGRTSHDVARSLGQTNEGVTRQSYLDPGTEQRAATKALVMKVGETNTNGIN